MFTIIIIIKKWRREKKRTGENDRDGRCISFPFFTHFGLDDNIPAPPTKQKWIARPKL
jgi:hypothetical protein